MALVMEIGFEECTELLRAGIVGRVALSTPDGPHIVPVNYSVHDRSVVVATSPYSVLGTYGRDAMVAFEVDGFDADTQEGWSVLVRGRAEQLDAVQLRRVKEQSAERPWADGARTLALRIPWTELSGRRLRTRGSVPVVR
jgi:nitroimidazol reductase NimA-like FMN-containing flavoprotein (pyridoxamine 5'-phosphate oxidase superfamily)